MHVFTADPSAFSPAGNGQLEVGGGRDEMQILPA
jgi:hypothetical protein